ncbi:hypothetical protein Aph02nite_62590 [Actinoplanes philippinensis]|uniref:Uncharacterized protein n=1 Tax=Actinoplanes philippinensis TaxID=35752 RepID=A0A1I2JPV8_9ACTN|nr:hypothetical protein Aph02nite_62590 [Actinoplanes philippinensis]SFF56624.1 hypothetical protein SAMN05421541_113189 [Actinoplanes philippinensis]
MTPNNQDCRDQRETPLVDRRAELTIDGRFGSRLSATRKPARSSGDRRERSVGSTIHGGHKGDRLDVMAVTRDPRRL